MSRSNYQLYLVNLKDLCFGFSPLSVEQHKTMISANNGDIKMLSRKNPKKLRPFELAIIPMMMLKIIQSVIMAFNPV